MNDRPEGAPSKTRRKQEAETLQKAGEKLLALPDAKLAQLSLPTALIDAIDVAKKLNQRGALRRQRQYIGRLMRELDTSLLQQALAAMESKEADEHAFFHTVEQWRDRLLTEGMPGLEAFFDAHPEAERQRLRQLVQAARAEEAAGKPPKHRRELFREIRHVLESGL